MLKVLGSRCPVVQNVRRQGTAGAGKCRASNPQNVQEWKLHVKASKALVMKSEWSPLAKASKRNYVKKVDGCFFGGVLRGQSVCTIKRTQQKQLKKKVEIIS